MVKFSSYYDWELRFKKKLEPKYKQKTMNREKEEKDNELGINEKLWKEYIKVWKETNLP